MGAQQVQGAGPGPHLFKYVSPSTARIVLETGRLRWTTPPLLNDPFDLTFDLHLDADPAEVRRIALDVLWSDYSDETRKAPLAALEVLKRMRSGQPRMTQHEFVALTGPGIDQALDRMAAVVTMNAAAQAVLQSVKLLCLTETPDDLLMWAHYAQQHQGAVLRFDRQAPGSLFSEARRVIYSEAMPRLGDSRTLAEVIAGRSFDTPSLLTAQVYTKAAAWSYEREWRIQRGTGRDPAATHEDLLFGEELLTGVVMGCRMPPEEREQLAGLARRLNPDVELLEAKPGRREFRIEVAPLALERVAGGGPR